MTDKNKALAKLLDSWIKVDDNRWELRGLNGRLMYSCRANPDEYGILGREWTVWNEISQSHPYQIAKKITPRSCFAAMAGLEWAIRCCVEIYPELLGEAQKESYATNYSSVSTPDIR